MSILTKILLGIFIKQWDTTMDTVIEIKVSWWSSTQFQVETNGCNYDTKPSLDMQSLSEGKVNILGNNSISHSKQKRVYMYMCPFLNGF